jgi:hypothetical protein
MSSNSRTTVSTELGLGLVGPEHTIVPLMASLSYSCQDPYAVKIAFHVGTDEPVEWTLARDLIAASLHARMGVGDVKAWPSAAPRQGPKTLNISMTSPFGHAQFEASAAAFETFLAPDLRAGPGRRRVGVHGLRRRADRTAQPGIETPGVPRPGRKARPEARYQAPADGGGITGGTIASIRCGPGSA